MKPSILLVLVFLCFSCGQDAQQIEHTFQQILSGSLNRPQLKSMLSQKSQSYISALAAISNTFHFDQAKHLGIEHQIPLSTMQLHALSVKHK